MKWDEYTLARLALHPYALPILIVGIALSILFLLMT